MPYTQGHPYPPTQCWVSTPSAYPHQASMPSVYPHHPTMPPTYPCEASTPSVYPHQASMPSTYPFAPVFQEHTHFHNNPGLGSFYPSLPFMQQYASPRQHPHPELRQFGLTAPLSVPLDRVRQRPNAEPHTGGRCCLFEMFLQGRPLTHDAIIT